MVWSGEVSVCFFSWVAHIPGFGQDGCACLGISCLLCYVVEGSMCREVATVSCQCGACPPWMWVPSYQIPFLSLPVKVVRASAASTVVESVTAPFPRDWNSSTCIQRTPLLAVHRLRVVLRMCFSSVFILPGCLKILSKAIIWRVWMHAVLGPCQKTMA